MIDFLAGERQHADHLIPIWLSLAASERGHFFCHASITDHLVARRVDCLNIVEGAPPRKGSPVVVASFQDLRAIKPRQVILVEHGAGQTYGDAHPSNPGGRERDTVALFLCPNETVAQLNRHAYPDARAEVVGSPKLDGFRGSNYSEIIQGVSSAPILSARKSHPTVALSFHWNNPQCPESRWALPYFKHALPALAERFDVIGHGHPRYWRFFERLWHQLGIEAVRDFDEVCRRADVYVCDNSSTIYEFAALDRPVVVLNSPEYRRDVHHGLRFWELIPGLQCDHADDLIDTVARALEDPPEVGANRRSVVRAVYPNLDGKAAIRAAATIRRLPC